MPLPDSGRCQRASGEPSKGISPRGVPRQGGGEETDLPSFVTPFVPLILAHALPIGAALLAAGVAIAFVGRAVGRFVLAVGVVVTAALAYREWLPSHDLLLAGGIVLAGLIISGLVAALVRWVAVLLEIGLFAGGWYLVVYATMGPTFLGTNVGLATWGIAAVIMAVLVDRTVRGRRLLRVAALPVVAAGTG